jgi:cyclohexanecarboxyl-CoA dehydrogenase
MEFKFSKKEELLQWAVNDFAEKELTDKALVTLDHVPKDIIKKMGDLGFFGLKIPEKYNGKPATWVMIGILAEEISKANIAFAYLVMLSYEVSLLLVAYGTEEAKEEWLCNLAKGNKLGCLSATESYSGSDISAIETKAIRDQDFYLISGEKKPISFGLQADVAVLFVKDDSETEGISSFLVPVDSPGITKSSIKNMGMFPSAPASFILDKVRVSIKYRIGEDGQGSSIHENLGIMSDFHQVMSGLISLGAAQTAMRLAISYSKQRIAFGHPIGKFEAISEKIAEDATLIEAAKWLCYRALALKDQGRSNAKEAAMCGWWCPKVAFQVIEDALLIHGHTGYSDDLPLQQMLRDIVAFEMIAGTEQILKQKTAQKVIGRIAVPDVMSKWMTD